MPEADDSFSELYRGQSSSPSAGVTFIQQSQLDFDIAFYDAILEHASEYVDVLRCQGELLSRKGLHDRALAIDRRLAGLLPDDPVVLYNLACSLAMGGMDDESLAALQAALESGYDDFEHLALDHDLDSLRAHSGFVALLRRFGADACG